MNDLQAQAAEYAEKLMSEFKGKRFNRGDLFYAIAVAYERGWLDCDTNGKQSETTTETFDDTHVCRYFSEGDYTKGLPDTPCEREGCNAYYPKETSNK